MTLFRRKGSYLWETESVLRAIGRLLRRLIKTTTVIVFTATVVPVAMIGAALGIVLFTPVPVTIPDKKTQAAVRPSYVYDANGDLLTVFRRVETNIPIDKKDIPKVLRQAVVAAEDRRFYTHNGVDAVGLVRAVRRDLQKGEAEQGASTITQQLVKAVYYPDDATGAITDQSQNAAKRNFNKVWRKLRIAVIANRLDRQMTKEDVLFQYLSNIFLGNGAYGVGAASHVYFRKPVSQLTLSEAATLAGIIPAPSKYEPRGNRSNAEFKRKATLRQMLELEYISESEYEEALSQELWVDTDGAPPLGKPVTLVFGPQEVKTKYPYFVDYVRRYLVSRYGEALLYGGGLQIRTTLDPILQDEAEKTAANALGKTNAQLEMSIVSVEPLTGFVKALVGGRDFYAPGGQVNLALGDCPTPEKLKKLLNGRPPKLAPTCNGRNYVDGGGSGRSPGSSMKPIVLAAAFDQGIPPTQIISGAQYLDPRCKKPVKGCVINNYEGASYGDVDLREATVRSVNTAYARLGYDLVGIENVARMAQNLGITSAWYDPARHGPSYSLGGIDVSPLEMAAAYSVFAGRGKRAPATPILTVIDEAGKEFENNITRTPRQVLRQSVADNVTNVLQDVVSSGTGRRAALGDRPVAGKTGTSQGYGNAWFVGYTPTLATAVWMGYKDRPRPLRNILGVGSVAGGTIPAATWGAYMKQAMNGIAPTSFDEPAPIKRPVIISTKELIKKKQREGFDLGPRKSIGSTSATSAVVLLGDGFITPPPPPVQNSPTAAPIPGTPASPSPPVDSSGGSSPSPPDPGVPTESIVPIPLGGVKPGSL